MKDKSKKTVYTLTRTAVIAALYAVLTCFLAPISYGPFQFRIAEAMTLLPILFPEAVVGLTLGCLIANIFSVYGWADIVFGSLATLVAAVLTRLIATKLFKNKHSELMPITAALPPVFVNAAILPLVWLFFAHETGYWINAAKILATQSAVIFILGIPLYYGLKKAMKK